MNARSSGACFRWSTFTVVVPSAWTIFAGTLLARLGLAEYDMRTSYLPSLGGVADMGGRQADGYEEVAAFRRPGPEGAIGDGVGREAADLHVAFVAHKSFAGHVALDVVRVHGVRRQADGVLGDARATAVLLDH